MGGTGARSPGFTAGTGTGAGTRGLDGSVADRAASAPKKIRVFALALRASFLAGLDLASWTLML